jgi:hypothetical protein
MNVYKRVHEVFNGVEHEFVMIDINDYNDLWISSCFSTGIYFK